MNVDFISLFVCKSLNLTKIKTLTRGKFHFPCFSSLIAIIGLICLRFLHKTISSIVKQANDLILQNLF